MCVCVWMESRKWTLPTFPTAFTDPGGKKTTGAYGESGHTLTCSGTQAIKPQDSRNQRPEFPNFILKYLGSSTPEATGCPRAKQKQSPGAARQRESDAWGLARGFRAGGFLHNYHQEGGTHTRFWNLPPLIMNGGSAW